MSNQHTPDALIAKADRACTSARILLDLKDVDGACNRAYYAMFDAARAALLASNALSASHIGKTHRGLMSAFNEHLVKSGSLPSKMGRDLKRAEQVRLIADYSGDPVEFEDAKRIVAGAESFVSDVRAKFAKNMR